MEGLSLWSLIHFVPWLIVRLPGIFIGGTHSLDICIVVLTLLLIVISAGLFLYFVVLGSPSTFTKDISEHLKEFTSSDESMDSMSELKKNDSRYTNSTNSFLIIGSDEDQKLDRESAFQCGWMYVTADYECPPKVNVSKFSAATSKSSRPPRSVFFCVLKDQSLFLYEGEAQTYCIACIPLKSSVFSIYPEDLFLDEIYAKEFPIKFYRSQRTLFLYFPSGLEKEDWYRAMLQATGELPQFSKSSQTALMSQLIKKCKDDAPPDECNLSWINALVGFFLNRMRDSGEIRDAVFARFERTIPLLQLPFFVNDVKLENFSLGNSGFPLISNGCLHSLGNDGELIASVDLDYEDGAALTVSCKLNFDFTGFSSLWFDTSLTIRVMRIKGRIQLRMKAPPSDRIWFGFEKKPLLQLDIEPALSTRPIKWPMIKSIIEAQIQEAINDILVLPNMSDAVIPPLTVGSEMMTLRPFPGKPIPQTLSASLTASHSVVNIGKARSLGDLKNEKSERENITDLSDFDEHDESGGLKQRRPRTHSFGGV